MGPCVQERSQARGWYCEISGKADTCVARDIHISMYQFPGIVMVDTNSIQVIKREFYALLQKDVRSRLF